MKLIHLSLATLFFMYFSGKPAPEKPAPVLIFEEFEENKREDGESIPWQVKNQLTWEDFLCAPEMGTDAVASTNTSLGVTYKTEAFKWTYSIVCSFSKSKSWGLLKTDYILAHEQAHFDITEIYARLLHKNLQSYDFNSKSFKKDIHEIYLRAVEGKENLQKVYDKETDHSRNKKMQMKWLEKINHLLEATAPYAAYP